MNHIKKKLLGPKMWGCNMTNLEPDEPNYVRGLKYPNGLDCSGFVTGVQFSKKTCGFQIQFRCLAVYGSFEYQLVYRRSYY